MALLHLFTMFLLISLSQIFQIFAENFEIYRAGFQESKYDSFQTPESICDSSGTSCYDYNAQQTSCKYCSCLNSNDTFGYVKDSWRCFGKKELRQETGCYVEVNNQKNPELFYVAENNKRIHLNLSSNPSTICTYNYSSDTYYRTCDGGWSTAGNIGSGTRYVFHNMKHQNAMRYWINVQKDDAANHVFEGRIMKLNFECKTSGTTTWNRCFIFKERYVERPISCQAFSKSKEPVIHDLQEQMKPSNVSYTLKSTSNSKEAGKGADVHKTVIIGVSAAAGVILIVIVTITCIVCCKRRQRSDISKYTAALYDSSQDQNSAGVYAETSIRLPSTSSSLTVGSHSNPAYERGRDMSIKIADSHVNPSSSRPQSPTARLQFVTNDSFEAEKPNALLAPKLRSTVKQRGNMLVKYENVTVLADELRPESVPDAERFYDNPGGQSPEYHVLENPEEVASYGSYSAELPTQRNSPPGEPPDVRSSYTNDVTEPDEPIYMNSPGIPSSGAQDNVAFSFDVPQDELELGLETIDYDNLNDHDDEDIYANSEAIRDSYTNENAAENPGYDFDDEEHDDKPIDEPIYDNQSVVDDRDGHTLLDNQSDKASLYQDLGDALHKESNYQPLASVPSKKPKPRPKPKPKPKPQ